MAKIEYHETPAGPHEFGDITTVIIMNEEEWEWFNEYLNRPRQVCSNKLMERMKEKSPWEK